VGSTPRGPRSRSGTPSAYSISLIAFETAGCDTARRVLAFAMLPACTTARKTCRSRNLSLRPIRSSQFIRAILTVRLWAYIIIEFLVIRSGCYCVAGDQNPESDAMRFQHLVTAIISIHAGAIEAQAQLQAAPDFSVVTLGTGAPPPLLTRFGPATLVRAGK